MTDNTFTYLLDLEIQLNRLCFAWREACRNDQRISAWWQDWFTAAFVSARQLLDKLANERADLPF